MARGRAFPSPEPAGHAALGWPRLSRHQGMLTEALSTGDEVVKEPKRRMQACAALVLIAALPISSGPSYTLSATEAGSETLSRFVAR